MFREFFCSTCASASCALLGALVFVLHHVFMAWLKYALNGWYELFYDRVQINVGSTLGSGSASFSGEEFAAAREDVIALLTQFVWIVSPAVVVHPVASYIRNMWVLQWRLSLIESYVKHWDSSRPAIEGAAQRVHEDTQRFANGMQSIVSALLDSTFTLAVFCPVLYTLRPRLMYIAVSSAVGGLCISMLVGHRLVGLEVENQVAEGAIRSELVQYELRPEELLLRGPADMIFRKFVSHLRVNYGRLYRNFAALSLWLSFYEQVMTILPYFLVAPMIFAARPEDRVTLGVLVKVANAYGKVFGSLNVISDRWLEVNEFRSVVKRLTQFERQMDTRYKNKDMRPLANTEDNDVYSIEEKYDSL